MRARTSQLTAVLLGTVIAAAVSACGIANPYSSPNTTKPTGTTASSTTETDPTPVNERNGTIPAAAATTQGTLAHRAGASTARAAVKTYVQLYINWTSHTVAANQKKLAAISLDAARAQALQAAASYGSDSVLQSSKVTNTGQILTISPGSSSAAGAWVVVTRETTTGSGNYQGLPAEDHLYLAQVIKTRTGWVISAWTPES